MALLALMINVVLIGGAAWLVKAVDTRLHIPRPAYERAVLTYDER